MLRFVAIATLGVGLSASALAQPPLPDTDIVLTPPSGKFEGFERVDYAVESIDLTALQGVPVISSKDRRRIGHVDDLYIDSASGITYLGLEIGGLFDIGDKEIVLPLDQVSVYRRAPSYPPADYQVPGLPGVAPTRDVSELDAATKEFLEKFAYRFEDFRIHIDATIDDLKSYPEFDLYQGAS